MKYIYLLLLIIPTIFFTNITTYSDNIQTKDEKVLVTLVYNTNNHDADITYYGRKVQIAPKTTLKGLNKNAITHLDKGVIISESLESRNEYEEFLTRGDINSSNGVAGLDENGFITSPINPNYMVIKNDIQVGIDSNKNSYAGNISETPKLTMFKDQSFDGKNIDPYTPWYDLFQIGGLQANDSKFFSIYGNPYGGGNFGAVDIVTMNGMNSGQRAGISAGDVNSIRTYMNFDAVARYTRTGSTPPRFIISEAIKDPDGISHKVTFNKDGATFDPALPKYWGDMLRKKMHVMTNWIGVSNESYPPKKKNARKPIRTYAGEIENWFTNNDGQVTGIKVNGWGIFESKSYNLKDAEKPDQIPGITTVDGSKPELDTDRTNFGKPALMVGVFTKAFDRNTICQINPYDSYGDINNPNGTIGDQVRECEGEELDLWQFNKKDYDSSFHGYTIAMTVEPGASQKLTTDSFGQWIEGGNALPTLLRLTGGYWDHGISIEGQGYQINVPYTVMDNVGDVQTSYSFSQPTKDGPPSIFAWKGYKDREKSDNWVGVSEHLQYKEQGSLTDEFGAIGGQLVFNPTDTKSNISYHYGVGLGSGGSFQFPLYGIIIDKDGNTYFPNGGAVNNGQGLGFIPSTGDKDGHPFIYAPSSNKLVFKTSANAMSDLEASNITADNGLTVLNGQGIGIVPIDGDSKGHPYITTENYNTLKTMYSDGKSYSNFITNILTSRQGIEILNDQGLGFIPSNGDKEGHPYIKGNGNITLDVMYSDGKTRGNLNIAHLDSNNGIDITKGSLGLFPDDGDKNGHPFLHSKNNNTVEFLNSAGGYSNISFNHINSLDGGEINNGKGLGFIPVNGDNQGHPYLTADSFNTIKTMFSGGNSFSSLKTASLISNEKVGLTINDSNNYSAFSASDKDSIDLKNVISNNYSTLILKQIRLMNDNGFMNLISHNGNNLSILNSDNSRGNIDLNDLNAYGSVNIFNGNGIGFIPSSGDGEGHPYFSASDKNTVNLKTSSGGKGDIVVKNLYADNIIYQGENKEKNQGYLYDIGNNTLELNYTDKTTLSNLKVSELSTINKINILPSLDSNNSYSAILSPDPNNIKFMTFNGTTSAKSNISAGDSSFSNINIDDRGKLKFNFGTGSYIEQANNNTINIKDNTGDYAYVNLKRIFATQGIQTDGSIDSTSDINTTGSINLKGNGIGFIPSTGDNNGHPYFINNDQNSIKLEKTSGGLGDLYINKIYYNGDTIINSDSNLKFVGNDEDHSIKISSPLKEPGTLYFNGERSDNKLGITLKGIWELISNSLSTYQVNYQPVKLNSSTDSTINTTDKYSEIVKGTNVYCTNCTSSLLNKENATQGIPVFWNGNEWTDSLGSTVVVH